MALDKGQGRKEPGKPVQFMKNLAFAFAAQGISLLLSVFMSLVVPKILGVAAYGYWQLFLFYTSYVGFCHLGLNDGIYLRNGGRRFGELDAPLLGTQLRLSAAGQFVLGAAISLAAWFFVEDSQRRLALVLAAAYMVVYNAVGFLGYAFQSTNHTRWCSVSVMADKVFFLACVLLLAFFRPSHFAIFALLYVCGKLVALVYCCLRGRKIVFAPGVRLRTALEEMKANIAAGLPLMFANIASTLILGLGRFTVDRRWGIEAFGKFSFSLSLTNFFLLFISQVSMVLFPALRRAGPDSLKKYYRMLRSGLGILLPAVLLAYIPMKYLLGLWLPQYRESLLYLALLLPLCTFDGKTQLLCTTYLKVLRKERLLLRINLLACGVSAVLSVMGAFLWNNIYAVVLSMVAAVAFRSFLAEYFLYWIMKIPFLKNILAEFFLAAAFMALSWFLDSWLALAGYLILYLVYLLLFRRQAGELAAFAKQLLKGKKAPAQNHLQ